VNKLHPLALFSTALWLCLPSSAQAEGGKSPQLASPHEVRRFALVIGAENYDYLEPATNALNDALEIVKVLRKANFSSIRFLPNPRDEVEIAEYIKNVRDWTGDANQPAIITFFYAGHGFMSKDRRPYIVPTNARPGHLLEDGVPLSSVLFDLSFHHAGISLFLFDACRTGISESGAKDDSVTPLGPQPSVPKVRAETYIHFATEEGAPAQSSSGLANSNNSPFTNELITYFPRPAVSTRVVFDKVHTWVPIHTGNSQFTIEVLDGVLTNLYMLPSALQRSDDQAAWMKALVANTGDYVNEFITEHPGSPYLACALNWHSTADGANTAGETDVCETK
jgi:hypothetical protein